MPKFSVKKPMTVFVIVVVIIALGIVSTLNMTPDLLPSIDLPYVVVMTAYPGATPEEVETSVTKPLEQSLATLENIKSIQSISNANYSLIMLEFENGSNMDTAVVNTLQSVDLIEGSWDEGIGSPNILKINPTMMPIAVAAVSMEGSTTEKVSSFVEDTLMNQLEGTTGVASISAGGLIESRANVVINEDKIEKLNEKLLDEASPDLADAKAELNQGMKQLKKAEAEIAQSRAELETKKSETYDQLEIAAYYNLIVNAAYMVEQGLGAALCFDLGAVFENLRFVPLAPRMETGSVLVWKKNQTLSAAQSLFIQHIRNAF